MRIIADGFVLEFEFDGRARHRGSALAQAAAPGHADPRARRRCWKRRASKSRPEMGLTKFRYEMHRRGRHLPDHHGDDRDVRPPRAGGGAMKYLRGHPGRRRVTTVGRYTFTADDIKAFAVRFDPQPFHVDEAAAERSP